MQNAARAETYFIAAMMVLILVICAVAIFVFMKTYKKEKAARLEKKQNKAEKKTEYVE